MTALRHRRRAERDTLPRLTTHTTSAGHCLRCSGCRCDATLLRGRRCSCCGEIGRWMWPQLYLSLFFALSGAAIQQLHLCWFCFDIGFGTRFAASSSTASDS
ncbi:uncharacterized protein ASCRUDRAFT_156893 [Ascoidea rubescens DSM 1968]|uniref:Uncharacterized protein n=1 Tax=Ascoidea rubescens DSM 1968 TaxID=1344418 RepID=A0A1D2VF55_9ASCO|nr:hypothetical protein ASCRUDRAFT_156893 [Ascoidea rubescens DSM 1968]ODV60143.1 hypothetical protein ASCRUDRAFT_156893 [Ascoidea rubescens DSM 1968]